MERVGLDLRAAVGAGGSWGRSLSRGWLWGLVGILAAGLLTLGCSDDSAPGADATVDAVTGPDAGQTDATADAQEGVDGGPDVDAAPDAGPASCHADMGPDDKGRFLVVSHPFDAAGQQDDRYEVVALGHDGSLTFTGSEFRMGRSSDAEIVFTPDGMVGFVPQSDGSLGIFTLGSDGTPTVVDSAFSGDFYASSLVMSPDGGRLYVLDSQWRDNGGGVYSFTIACDGTLTEEGLVAEAKLPYAMKFVGSDSTRVFLYARDALDVQDGSDSFLLSWSEPVSVTATATLFSEDAIVASCAVTANGRHILVGDNCGFCNTDNRVGILSLDANGLSVVQVLSPLEDPMALVASPFDDAALVVSGFGNAIYVLSYDAADSVSPFALEGELGYLGGAPQLPAKAVMLRRGTLTGMVFVGENLGIRRVQFRGGGLVEDLGVSSSGSGTERVVGSIGLQP